jgi:Ca-activated chloride channel family protein
MKYKYSKYVPNLLDELDMDELMSKLSDLLMSSGFGNPRDTMDDSDRTMQALHDAILEALFSGGVLPDDLMERLFGKDAEGSDQDLRDQLDELIQQIIERMKDSGYITTPPDLEPEKARRAMGGGTEGQAGEVKFEVTDKALDFLGYRALRDLLGSAGHSSAGRHDTRDLSTGIEASGAPKPYEFGDVMNLDVTETILNAVKRLEGDGFSRRQTAGTEAPALQTSGIDIDYQDLMVAQGEYQSSCATAATA